MYLTVVDAAVKLVIESFHSEPFDWIFSFCFSFASYLLLYRIELLKCGAYWLAAIIWKLEGKIIVFTGYYYFPY